MRRLLALVFGMALLAALVLPVQADIPILYASGSLGATGVTPVFTLSGQSTCSMVLGGTWTGTATPQGSSDKGATYNTVASIGAQTANGTFGGDVSSYTTGFRVSWVRSSGTLTYAISCSAAVNTSNVTIGSANVTVVNTPGVAVQNFPSPWPSSSPGKALLVVLANASASPSNAVTVNTPAPAATGAHGGVVVEGVASGTTVPVSGAVTQGTSPWLIGKSAGGATPITVCNDTPIFLSITSTGTTNTLLLEGVGGESIHICSWTVYVAAGTLPGFSIFYATAGSGCSGGTGTDYFGGTSSAVGEIFSAGSNIGDLWVLPTSKQLCMSTEGTGTKITGLITISQQAP